MHFDTDGVSTEARTLPRARQCAAVCAVVVGCPATGVKRKTITLDCHIYQPFRTKLLVAVLNRIFAFQLGDR